jgi:hypothetical protein
VVVPLNESDVLSLIAAIPALRRTLQDPRRLSSNCLCPGCAMTMPALLTLVTATREVQEIMEEIIIQNHPVDVPWTLPSKETS